MTGGRGVVRQRGQQCEWLAGRHPSGITSGDKAGRMESGRVEEVGLFSTNYTSHDVLRPFESIEL